MENLNERYRVNILEYPYEENPYHYKTFSEYSTALQELEDISLHSIGNLEDKISEIIDICCLKDELEKRYYENLNERYDSLNY